MVRSVMRCGGVLKRPKMCYVLGKKTNKRRLAGEAFFIGIRDWVCVRTGLAENERRDLT